MKITKTTVGGVEIIINAQELAEAIGKAVAHELAPLLEELRGQPRPGPVSLTHNTRVFNNKESLIEIDDSIVDVGVSTAGLEKGSNKPLATEVSKEDNVSGARSKLKNLKDK